jgi:hypothetical protein
MERSFLWSIHEASSEKIMNLDDPRDGWPDKKIFLIYVELRDFKIQKILFISHIFSLRKSQS